jgi:hypothetical protein
MAPARMIAGWKNNENNRDKKNALEWLDGFIRKRLKVAGLDTKKKRGHDTLLIQPKPV